MSSSMREFSGENYQSPVQQMRPFNWWINSSNLHIPFDSHLFLSLADNTSSIASSLACSSFSSSPSYFHPYVNLSSQLPLPYHQEQPDPTEPWNQLLLGDAMVGEDGRCSFTGQWEHRKVENRVDQVVFPTVTAFDVKQEITSAWHGNQNNHQQELLRSSWNEAHDLQAFPTKSCMNRSFFMNNPNSKKHGKLQHHDHSSKNDTTSATSTTKKARVQSTNFKVRKEKLGDRIAALHQLVSPFGKTDTASVLSEATGYIRFLQSQIEALSSPYLGRSSSSCSIYPVCDQRSDQPSTNYKDLRSRGLCLVPLSCTSLEVGDDGGAQFWASAFGGDFQ